MVPGTTREKDYCARNSGLAALATALAAGCGTAQAGSFDLWGIEAEYQLQTTYSLATRLKAPHAGIVDSPPSPEIPLPDYLKVPESANYDDGDRNFGDGAIVNNRLTALGELHFIKDEYGVLLRGDAFYDDPYHRRND